MNVACQQKPSAGELVKLNFDLFPRVSTPTTSASPSGVTVTVTTTSLAPTLQSAGATASPSPASISTSSSHSSNVKIGVGVGVGVGAIAALLAIIAFIFLQRRSDQQREKSEGETRARLEAEYQARLNYKQGQEYRIHELGAPQYIAEVDNGQNNIPMLESPENHQSPQTSRSSATLGGSVQPYAGSPKPGSQRSFGMPRLFGKPLVPEKDTVRGDAGE